MADLAKYRQDLDKFQTSYAKAALKEPVNFWALAGFLAAAAFTGEVYPLLLALILEAIYVVVMPNLSWYRHLVQKREHQRKYSTASRSRGVKDFISFSRPAL